MTPDEVEAVKMISKGLEGTSIALANLIADSGAKINENGEVAYMIRLEKKGGAK